MNKITVHVTQQDIEAGKPRECSACPVAIAVKRTLQNVYRVSVLDAQIRVTFHDNCRSHTYYYCPLSVDHFVCTFDSGTRPLAKPFSFKTWKIPGVDK